MSTITLPWPDKRLSANARQHYHARARVAKTAKQSAFWLTKAAGITTPADGPIALRVTFHAPDNRRRDMDNAVAAMKASLDGVADALRVDDVRFALSFAWGAPEKPGRVDIEIGAALHG